MPYPVPPPAPPPVVDILAPEDLNHPSSIQASSPATGSVQTVAAPVVKDFTPVEKFPPEISTSIASERSKSRANVELADLSPAAEPSFADEAQQAEPPDLSDEVSSTASPILMSERRAEPLSASTPSSLTEPAFEEGESRAELLGSSIEVGLSVNSAGEIPLLNPVTEPSVEFGVTPLNADLQQTGLTSTLQPASPISPLLVQAAELPQVLAIQLPALDTLVEESPVQSQVIPVSVTTLTSLEPTDLDTTEQTSLSSSIFTITALPPDFQQASAIRPLSVQSVEMPRALALQLPILDRLIEQRRSPHTQRQSIASPLSQVPDLSNNPSSTQLDAIPSELPDSLPSDLSEPLPDAESYPIPVETPESLPDVESYPIPVDLPEQIPDVPSDVPLDEQSTPPGQILVIPEPGDIPEVVEEQTPPAAEPQQPTAPSPSPNVETVPVTPDDVVELRADRQEYDTLRRIITAEGNAVMQFRQGVLAADRLQVNLPNRTAIAEGNAVLTRGDQILRGERFTYNFTQEQGTIFNARGEIFLPSSQNDFSPTLPTDVSAGTYSNVPLTEQIIAEQPVTGITSEGGLTFNVGEGTGTPTTGGGGPGTTGSVRRLRFEAEQINFVGENWVATNVRLTNDPFSPPELELRSSRVTFTRLSPTASEIRARRPHIVIDQGFRLPFPRNRVVIDQRDQNPGLIQFGYDEGDRGGLFIESTFSLIAHPRVRFSVTPQILVQRAIDDGGDFLDLRSYALSTRLEITPDPFTTIEGVAVFTSLNPDDWEDQLRASLRVRRRIFNNYRLTAEYSYRDRLFNGSLGFQNVQRSIGLILTSPIIPLGDTGINLSFQVGAQYINANTNRLDLLPAIRENNRIDLGRFQASVALNRGFFLWTGRQLPRTPDQGMRYTPNPVLPYVQLFTGVRAVASYYTSDDTQLALTGTIGLRGQFGHFSRDFLDYTGFNISYSRTAQDGDSPFLFDRSVDRQVISGGIIQQLVGPIRIGFQTSINLDTDTEIDTDYILEYSRRTFAITLRYNPVREIGLLSFRLNDFNWSGTPEPFSGLDDGTVEGGVRRGNN